MSCIEMYKAKNHVATAFAYSLILLQEKAVVFVSLLGCYYLLLYIILPANKIMLLYMHVSSIQSCTVPRACMLTRSDPDG